MKSKIWKIPYSKPVIPLELLAAGYTPLLAAVLDLRGAGLTDLTPLDRCTALTELDVR